MKKRLAYILFLCCLLTGCGAPKTGVMLRQILQDTYCPTSMEAFQESKKKYAPYLSERMLSMLYTSNGDELTEADLTRKVEIISMRYSKAENNSKGMDTYEIVYTVKGSNVDKKLCGTFYAQGSKVKDGVIEYAR